MKVRHENKINFIRNLFWLGNQSTHKFWPFTYIQAVNLLVDEDDVDLLDLADDVEEATGTGSGSAAAATPEDTKEPQADTAADAATADADADDDEGVFPLLGEFSSMHDSMAIYVRHAVIEREIDS